MYKNLLAEMARRGINNLQIAKAIGINPSTLSAKLNSYDRLKLCEAERIKEIFFPGMSIEYLFATEPEGEDKSA